MVERLASEDVWSELIVSAWEISESYEALGWIFGLALASVFLRVCLSKSLLESVLREKNFMLFG